MRPCFACSGVLPREVVNIYDTMLFYSILFDTMRYDAIRHANFANFKCYAGASDATPRSTRVPSPRHQVLLNSSYRGRDGILWRTSLSSVKSNKTINKIISILQEYAWRRVVT